MVSRFAPPRHVVLKNSGERTVQSPELQRVMNVASNSFVVPTGMLSFPFVTVDTTWYGALPRLCSGLCGRFGGRRRDRGGGHGAPTTVVGAAVGTGVGATIVAPGCSSDRELRCRSRDELPVSAGLGRHDGHSCESASPVSSPQRLSRTAPPATTTATAVALVATTGHCSASVDGAVAAVVAAAAPSAACPTSCRGLDIGRTRAFARAQSSRSRRGRFRVTFAGVSPIVCPLSAAGQIPSTPRSRMLPATHAPMELIRRRLIAARRTLLGCGHA